MIHILGFMNACSRPMNALPVPETSVCIQNVEGPPNRCYLGIRQQCTQKTVREVGAQADQPPATPRDILLKEGEEGHGSDATTKASNGVSQSVSP